MVINAMKVFDIVFVMGSPENNGTEVVAERMLTWFFVRNNQGYGAAVAVVLFLAVIPVMIANVRRFRAEEAIRCTSAAARRAAGSSGARSSIGSASCRERMCKYV